MKWLLFFVLIAGVMADPISKAEEDVDKQLTELDAKYAQARKKILVDYVSRLKTIRTAYTKRGDFENAMKADKAIKDVTPSDKKPIIGQWKWHSGSINNFYADGRAIQTKRGVVKHKGTWVDNGDGSFTVKYPGVQDGIYKIKDNNIISPGDIIAGKKILAE